jgi:hypothetical protein
MVMKLSVSTRNGLVASWFGLVGGAAALLLTFLLVPNELVSHVGRPDMFWFGMGLVILVATILLPLLILGTDYSRGSASESASGILPSWPGFVLYAASLAVSASLAVLLILVALGPQFKSGEHFEAVSISWLHANIAFLGLSFLSLPVYRIFCASTASYMPGLLYVLNLTLVAIVGMGITWLLGY